MSQVPEIKPEVNKEENKEEKKGGGFLGSLFGSGGGAGSGAMGGLGGAAAGGGILATKAGLVALILVGSTVAGGLGLVGYRAFSPSHSGSGSMSLFEARPKPAPGAEGAEGEGAAGGGSGVSASLDYFAKANAGAGDGAPAAEAPPIAPTAATADAAASASASASRMANNNAPASGPAASLPKLSGGAKIGQMSGSGGGGGTSASMAAGGAPGQFGGARAGSISGMRGGAGDFRGAGGAKNYGAARRSGAYKTLGAIRRDHRGATSSQVAGQRYDRAVPGGSTIGSEGGEIVGGEQQGARATGDTKTTPNKIANDRDQENPPPPPPPKEVTPWQKEISLAKNLLMGAALCLFLAAQLAMVKEPTDLTKVLRYALAAIGGLLALYAMYLGIKVLGGKYGQGTLGTIFLLSGALLTATSVGLLLWEPKPDDVEKGLTMASLPTWLGLCGVVGIVGVVSTFFLKPGKVKCEGKYEKLPECEDDATYYKHGPPSEQALKEFVV